MTNLLLAILTIGTISQLIMGLKHLDYRKKEFERSDKQYKIWNKLNNCNLAKEKVSLERKKIENKLLKKNGVGFVLSMQQGKKIAKILSEKK